MRLWGSVRKQRGNLVQECMYLHAKELSARTKPADLVSAPAVRDDLSARRSTRDTARESAYRSGTLRKIPSTNGSVNEQKQEGQPDQG